MSDFSDTNILRKILNAISKPVAIQGTKKWRDDFSGSALSSDWEVLNLGSGQSISVSNSILQITTGVTANAQTIIKSKKTLTIPCRINFLYALTQRIVNQSFYLEIVDSSGNNYARVLLNGTSTNSAFLETANNAVAGTNGAVTTQISSSFSIFEFDLGVHELKLYSRALETAQTRSWTAIRHRRLPDPSLEYYIQIRSLNGSIFPSSATNLLLDSISYEAYELINADLSATHLGSNNNDAIGVNVLSSVSISSTVSIADGGSTFSFTTTTLAANATYNSGTQSIGGRNSLTVIVYTDQPGTLYFEQSQDNILFLDYGSKNCVAGVNTFDFRADLNSYRIRYVNGNTAQGIFRIYVKTRT